MGFVSRMSVGVRRVIRPQSHSTIAPAPTYTRRGVLALSGRLLLGGAAAAFAGPLVGCESTGGLQCGDSLKLISDQLRSQLSSKVGLSFVGGRMVYEGRITITGRNLGLGNASLALHLGVRPELLGFNVDGRYERKRITAENEEVYSACAGAVADCSPYVGMEKVGLVIGGVRATAFDKPGLVKEKKADGTDGIWAVYDALLSYSRIPDVDTEPVIRPVLQEKTGLGRYIIEARIREEVRDAEGNPIDERERPAYFEVDKNGELVSDQEIVSRGFNPVDPANLVEAQALYVLTNPSFNDEREAVWTYAAVDLAGTPLPNRNADRNDISDRIFEPVFRNDLYTDQSNTHSVSIEDVIAGNADRGVEALGLEGLAAATIPLKATIELIDRRSRRTTHAIVEIPELEKLEFTTDPVTEERTPNLSGITEGINPETGETVPLSRFFDGGGSNFEIVVRVQPQDAAGTPSDYYGWVVALDGDLRLEGCL